MYKRSIAAFIRLLGPIGAFPTRRTLDPDLRALMRRLHPVNSAAGFLRLGCDGDGGYLVPDDIDGIASCWSAGVGTDSSFEADCADRGMEVFLTDGSVEGPAQPHPRFHFTRAFLGSSETEACSTLASWMASARPDSPQDQLLKLDIEGAEYDVLLATPPELLARCRVIIVEFHQLDLLWSAPFFRLAAAAIHKLLHSHACVHIHPNNHDGVLRYRRIDLPPTMEFTFLRRDRLSPVPQWRADFPHPLDHDNTPGPTLVLPPCWYRSDAAAEPGSSHA